MSRDLLVTGIGELVTNAPRSPDLVGARHDAAVAIRAGRVAWAGITRVVLGNMVKVSSSTMARPVPLSVTHTTSP